MSGPYGVTPAGFVVPPLTVIQAQIQALVLQTIDPNLDVADDQPLGQLIGIMAAREAALWEILQVAFNATNRGDAENFLLDNIGAITGTKREGETPSSVPCTAVFSIAGTYAAGSLAAFIAGTPSQQWTNQLPLVVPSTSNDGSGQPISTSHPYTFSSANGNTPTWISTADGPIYGDALIAANVAASQANGALNQQVPVAGWVSIADAGSVTLGTLEELDPPYRVRQRQELAAPGSATLDAIGAKILAALAALNNGAGVPGASVTMYENTALVTDGNGLPGKSFLAVVYDGNPSGGTLTTNDQAIAGAIWNSKPAGMQDYGTHSVVFFDSLGIARTIYFDRNVNVTLTLNFTIYTLLTGAALTALKAAIGTALANATQGLPYTLFGTTITPAVGDPRTLTPGSYVVLNLLRGIILGQAGMIDVPLIAMVPSVGSVDGDGNYQPEIEQLGVVVVGTIAVTNQPLP